MDFSILCLLSFFQNVCCFLISVAEGLQLATVAKVRRQTCSNNINGESSRSHCIYQLELACKDSNGSEHVSNMCIVDLAGSERARRTGNALTSIQQREAAQINASLMNLMQCIQKLSSNQDRPISAGVGVVPFRGSKLSHLFMNYLTGASTGKTAMIVSVNPAAVDFDETQHVLSYAIVAKNVRINSDDYQKKISAISAYKSVAHKASYESGNDGRRKRSSDRSKENSASRKVAKIAKNQGRNKLLIDKINSLKGRLIAAQEENAKLIETNLCLEAVVDSYRKQTLVTHSAELLQSSTLEHKNYQKKGHQIRLDATLSAELTTEEVYRALINNSALQKHLRYLIIGEKEDRLVAMQMSFYTRKCNGKIKTGISVGRIKKMLKEAKLTNCHGCINGKDSQCNHSNHEISQLRNVFKFGEFTSSGMAATRYGGRLIKYLFSVTFVNLFFSCSSPLKPS